MMTRVLQPVLLVTMLAALLAQFAAKPVLAARNPQEICASAITRVEQVRRVPRMLMHAVSLAESGRWDRQRQASFAWPWTVTAHGKGRFFPDRDTAIAEVRKLQAAGVRNIDVGCMQINLNYHKNAFEALNDAFDPAINATYAAGFLKNLRRDAGSWAHAVGRYHSGNWEKRGKRYWRKVNRLWNAERRRDFRDRRDARIRAQRQKLARLQPPSRR